jgi:hypothetical protein
MVARNVRSVMSMSVYQPFIFGFPFAGLIWKTIQCTLKILPLANAINNVWKLA